MKHFGYLLFLIAVSSHAILFGFESGVPTNNQRKNNLVIVSCSGKSGSSTLAASFKKMGFETYHCHSVNKLYDLIIEREQEGNVILIDSIRDIFARKISSFFQNISKHTNLSVPEILERYKKYPKLFLRSLQKIFKKNILIIANNHAFQSWKHFDYNCLTDGEFDFEKKYQLKRIGNLYFVNLRFDDIKNWEEIIKSIGLPMNLRRFKIITTNQADDKWYKDIYRDFLDHFTLTQSEFDTILSKFSAELAHFYTTEEIQEFISKWERRIQ